MQCINNKIEENRNNKINLDELSLPKIPQRELKIGNDTSNEIVYAGDDLGSIIGHDGRTKMFKTNAGVIIPTFDAIKKDPKQIKELLQGAHLLMPSLMGVSEALKKNEFEILVYDPNNKKIPQGLHNLMSTGKYGAITSHEAKMVIFNLETYENVATQRGLASINLLLEGIGNEAIHIMSKNRLVLGKAPGENLSIEQRTSRTESIITENKNNFKKLTVEEIVSELSGKLLAERFLNHQNSFYTKEIFNTQDYKQTLKLVMYSVAARMSGEINTNHDSPVANSLSSFIRNNREIVSEINNSVEQSLLNLKILNK